MSEKITEATWRDYLEAAAVRATDSKAEQYRVLTNGKDLDDDAREKTYKAYLERLKTAYPYKSAKMADLEAIDMFDAERMRAYLDQFNAPNRTAPSPTEYRKAAKAADILPLLQGVAKEGNDWYGMQSDDLKEIGAKLGYNVRDPQGYKEFLDEISEQQINYDRAKLWEDYKTKSGDFNYALDNILYPSAMQELQNAVLTGEGSEDAVKKLAYMDKVANVATAGMPSVPVSKVASPLARLTKSAWLKSPITTGMTQAVLQGVTEAGRQGMKENLSETGIKFDKSAPFVATSLGATAPGMIGTVRQLVSQSQGKAARDFGRGLMKATRYGDPVAIERSGIEDLLNRYNNFTNNQETGIRIVTEAVNRAREKLSKYPRVNAEEIAKEVQKSFPEFASRPLDKVVEFVNRGQMPQGYRTLVSYPLDELADLNMKPKVNRILKYLGSGYKGADGKVLVDKVLERYDKPVAAITMLDGASLKPAPSDVIRNNQKIENVLRVSNSKYRSKNVARGAEELSKESLDQFQKLFPAKAAEAYNKKTGSYKAGEVLGQLLQNAGGRVEPTIKVNPFKIPDAVLDDKPLKDVDYKDEQWYKNLSVKSRKIIDDAFKNKEEEEE